jgi:hypothetical protein
MIKLAPAGRLPHICPMPQVRVVIFKDEDQWVAQCLEHDICVQAPCIDQIPPRMKTALELEGVGLEGLPAAPDEFFKMWLRRSEFFKYSGAEADCELALCA